DAYAEAKRVAQANPEDGETLQIEADLAYRTKHPADADQLLAKLRALSPGEPENTARAVVVLARNGRGRDAAKVADDWAARHPQTRAGPLLSGRGWIAAGKPDSAVARARRAVAMAPDSTEPMRLLARTLQDASRFAESESEWLVLRAKLPDEPGVL